MRKWMRERLQRRKKNTAAPTDQPAAPPLQPAYFDAEDPDAAGDEPEHAPSEAASSEPEEQDSAPDAAAEAQSPETQPMEGEAKPSRAASGAANRNRRRRGGRGRGGRGREQAVAQAFAPAAVKGSIPAVEPAETMADEGEPASADVGDDKPEPIAAAIPQAPAVAVPTQRTPKGIVVLAIGLPGSGKSTWFKRHNIVPLSSDMVRALLFDDAREQRFQDLVFSNLRSMLKARLIAKRPTNYVDATNLTPQERQHWIKLAKDYNYEVHAVFFDVPLEVCIERHQRRDRVVPEDVMRRMAAKLKPPAFNEGFAKITVVRVKKKEAEAGSEVQLPVS
jgi:predicted kinase